MADPYPKNVAGDFYREDGCCMTCSLAIQEAPINLIYDEDEAYGGCFVAKQPDGDAEVGDLIGAFEVTEVDCFRYRGRDPDVIKRLTVRGLSQFIDNDGEAELSHQRTAEAMARRSPRPETVLEIPSSNAREKVVIRRHADGRFDFVELHEHRVRHARTMTDYTQWAPNTVSTYFNSSEDAEAAARADAACFTGRDEYVEKQRAQGALPLAERLKRELLSWFGIRPR